ncbi:hypothetical protein H9L39_17862 [Fusarium oxysporum f. sp. albedinis]|nr:hypothetical protein H9L39_17862 [Fusarium oxysporum f. sp. albedinis]
MDAKGLDGTVDPFYNAVAQLAVFYLQTCREPGKSNLWKEKAILRLSKWPQPHTEMRGGTTEEESPQSMRSASSYAGSVTAAQKLTVQLRHWARASCNPQQQPDADNDTSDEESAGGASGRSHGLHASLEAKAPALTNLELEARSYCTQDCLLGLKRNQFLDEKCPNVSLHRIAIGSMSHPINAAHLLDLLREDLAPLVRRLRSIRPLDGHGKYGRTGALFKISLSRYGYTFASKGTFAAAVGRTIALDTPFPLAAADIIHMLLMAWVGDVVTIKDNGLSEGLRFQQLLFTCGVIHNDMRQENLLWNSERGHILLIDFDLATILPDMRQMQLKRLSNKRKRHVQAGNHSSQFFGAWDGSLVEDLTHKLKTPAVRQSPGPATFENWCGTRYKLGTTGQGQR